MPGLNCIKVRVSHLLAVHGRRAAQSAAAQGAEPGRAGAPGLGYCTCWQCITAVRLNQQQRGELSLVEQAQDCHVSHSQAGVMLVKLL